MTNPKFLAVMSMILITGGFGANSMNGVFIMSAAFAVYMCVGILCDENSGGWGKK